MSLVNRIQPPQAQHHNNKMGLLQAKASTAEQEVAPNSGNKKPLNFSDMANQAKTGLTKLNNELAAEGRSIFFRTTYPQGSSMQGAFNIASSQKDGFVATQKNKLAENMDDFFKLLMVQLKNQDPLKPMESKDLTSQLVQFSSVEQSIHMNKQMEELIAMNRRNLNDSMELMDREVSFMTDAVEYKNDKPVTLSYEIPHGTVATKAYIFNPQGELLQVVEGMDIMVAGRETLNAITWDGKNRHNQNVLPGLHRVMVSAVDRDGVEHPIPAYTAATVTGIETSNNGPMLSVGQLKVKPEEVRSIYRRVQNMASIPSMAAEQKTMAPTLVEAQAAFQAAAQSPGAVETQFLSPIQASNNKIVKAMGEQTVKQLEGQVQRLF